VALLCRQSLRVRSGVDHGGGGGVSREQLVGPVVYGQHVPEEPPVPPADVADAALPFTNEADSGKFLVRLDNFTGPFDLLLQLIGKHKLDVTEVALHQVTDDFIAYIRAMGDDWDLGEASEFLLVAATLLDLKAARLLPAAEVEDEEDLALLEARDLLFARLLQYKAFKEAAAYIADLEGTGAKRWPRAVSMEPRYAEALPDLVLGVGVERLFKLALKQFTPKPGPPQVSIAHIHQVRVSVREHAALLRDRLRRAGSATFTMLVADCESTLEVVARFLALLELYREGLIDFEQPVSLDELTVRWIGGDAPDADLDIDDYEGSPPDPDATGGAAAESADDDDAVAEVAGHDGADESADDDDAVAEVAGHDGADESADDDDAVAEVAGHDGADESADDDDAVAEVAGHDGADESADDDDAVAEVPDFDGAAEFANHGVAAEAANRDVAVESADNDVAAVAVDHGAVAEVPDGDGVLAEAMDRGGVMVEVLDHDPAVEVPDDDDVTARSPDHGDVAVETTEHDEDPDDLWSEGSDESDGGDSAGSGLGKSGAGEFDSADRSGDLGGDEDDAEGSAVEERS
jgi:segregation and condensation protein A